MQFMRVYSVSVCVRGKFLSIKIVPPAHPSVKRVPGLVLGAKCTGCASRTANGTGGTTGCPYLQWESKARRSQYSLPGLQEVAPHRHDVPA